MPQGANATDYVFPGAGKAGRFVGLPKVGERIAKRAVIKGVSVHGP